MWLFTQQGFLSAVQHRDNHDLLMVRARDRASLEPLVVAFGAEVLHTPRADYPYRVIVAKNQFSGWCSQQVQQIDYDNFKNRMYGVRGRGFVEALHDVWAAMRGTEDSASRRQMN